MTARNIYNGPPLFSSGFRPFFLAAILFALGVIPVWWGIWRGGLTLEGPFAPVDWHIHEMIYGYGAVVVAGFLFTAVPNWTGRFPTRGWPLFGLLMLWIAGRLAVAGATGLGPLPVLFLDQLFLFVVAAMIGREIVAGRNWRNLKVLIPVLLMWIANVLFHVQAMTWGTAELPGRLGIVLLILLIMLIGGRILPSFTRNWLAQRNATVLPTAFNQFDAVCIASGILALAAWTVAPVAGGTSLAAIGAGILHALRLSRWRGTVVWPSPLLLMLHVAYAMIPLGFLSIALSACGLVSPAVSAHVFGIGAIGGMTVAVMMRATMGHTGRALVAGPVLTTAFFLVIGAMLFRIAGAWLVLGRFGGIDLAIVLWIAGFGLLLARIGPWLIAGKVARRPPARDTSLPPREPAMRRD